LRTLVTGRQTVAFLKERMRPISAEDVARWLGELDSDTFTVRENATQQLERLGKFVEPALKKALEREPSLEAKRRLERLLQRLEDMAPAPERLRALRGLDALEQIGTPDARKILETVAGGAPDAELTLQAKEALGRLQRKP